MNVSLDYYPQEVQDKIKNTLQAYRSVYVFENKGNYRVSTAIGIADVEVDDILEGVYYNTDLYTQVEIDNFNKSLPDMNW